MNELMVNAHASEYGVPCRWQASDSHVENVIRSEIGVQEPSERLKHAEGEGSGKVFP